MANQALVSSAMAGLVERVLDGDGHAFTEIVRAHDGQLRAQIRRLVPNEGQVDDLMQETYVRAFKALGRFRGDAALATWLYRIAHNVCMDDARRRSVVALVRPVEDGTEPVWPGADPGDVASTRSAIAQALGTLNAAQRAVVLLVDRDGLDYAEAAEVLGLPVGTIASRLHRARAGMRQSLEASSREAA